MNIYQKWQRQDTPGKNRVPALMIGALIFPIGIPALLILLAPRLDEKLGFGCFYFGPGNFLVGGLLILIGGAAAFWTVVVQIRLASGTPFPMMPTKKFLVVGPFRYCRNPMTLGTILAYAGIAAAIGSISALTAVVLLAAGLIGYLKLFEEDELRSRFGDEYLEYKRKTPFLLPVPRRK
jgi:protein-S-isoprenylcysteine O-methyltransferase Ste14